MKYIEGNTKNWIRMAVLMGKSKEEIKEQIRTCYDMDVAISRALYLINEGAYENSTHTGSFDGFCIRIEGYDGSVACSEFTVHNYETLGTDADNDIESRTLNPIEAIMNILSCPTNRKHLTRKEAAIKVLKTFAQKHGSISESDADLMRWAMAYAMDVLKDCK